MGVNIIFTTKRLFFRELMQSDFNILCDMLQDKEVMKAYEHAFSLQEAQDWLEKQFHRYQTDGFGLWAVIVKQSGEMIGQAGLTIQQLPTGDVPEIGYLFRKAYWHQGYAIEVAQAIKSYAFEVLGMKEVYSIIRDNNLPSQKVALRNGMTKIGTIIKHYYQVDMPHFVYQAKNKRS